MNEDTITNLFCNVDDFGALIYKEFAKEILPKKLSFTGKPGLSESEIMTIIICAGEKL